jgi:hypothetical protein
VKQYSKHVCEDILEFFGNLKHLSVIGSPYYLSIRDISLATCSSSSLYKLCISLNFFEDCFTLLDGCLKHLTTLIVDIGYTKYQSSVVYEMVSLYIIRLMIFKFKQVE